jgi:hypothetical protein
MRESKDTVQKRVSFDCYSFIINSSITLHSNTTATTTRYSYLWGGSSHSLCDVIDCTTERHGQVFICNADDVACACSFIGGCSSKAKILVLVHSYAFLAVAGQADRQGTT